jgi:hypothetical protein
MILKLDRTGCAHHKFDIIDDIASVGFARDEENDTETDPARNPRATAYVKYRNGAHTTFNVNHIAYVMNDAGKTIDTFTRNLPVTPLNPLGETAGETRLRLRIKKS